MKNLIQFAQHQKLLRNLKNDFWARAYAQYSLWPNQVHVEPKTGFLRLEGSDLQLDQTQSAFLPALQYAQSLVKHGGLFKRSTDGEITFEIDELFFLIQIPQDLDILYEVFSCGCYRLKLPPSQEKCVLWDIGMNVGIASLYFARQKAIEAVIGYEPFNLTFRQAERQFAFNPSFCSKITAVNRGIGAKNEVLSVAYDLQNRGSLSVFDLPEGQQGALREKVEIDDAALVLQGIIERYPGRHIIVKMDCEGGEHRILPALSQAKLLPSIKALILEWHGPDSQRLEQLLTENGFSFFSISVLANTQGYIYALHQKI